MDLKTDLEFELAEPHIQTWHTGYVQEVMLSSFHSNTSRTRSINSGIYNGINTNSITARSVDVTVAYGPGSPRSPSGPAGQVQGQGQSTPAAQSTPAQTTPAQTTTTPAESTAVAIGAFTTTGPGAAFTNVGPRPVVIINAALPPQPDINSAGNNHNNNPYGDGNVNVIMNNRGEGEAHVGEGVGTNGDTREYSTSSASGAPINNNNNNNNNDTSNFVKIATNN